MIVIYLILSIIVLGSIFIWLYLFFFLKKSFDHSHTIKEDDENYSFKTFDKKILPMLSVIVPARNEEKYIRRCISSLLLQDYDNYEIIIVDDCSTDNTLQILNSFDDKKIKIIKADEKPTGWIGKNWPCYLGYKESKGDFLLFTDADTIHSKRSLSASFETLKKNNLDVLTAVPHLIFPTLIIKMVIPILSIFMYSRYSPMRVNDARVKIGYLFGSYFILSKRIYEEIGTHQSVKEEIVEDGALGQKIKDMGYKLKMFRGEKLVEAYWARDFQTLWNSLKRLIIPIYFKDKKNSILMTAGIFLLMMFPFLSLVFSALGEIFSFNEYTSNLKSLNTILLWISIISVISIFITNYYQLKRAGTHNKLYSLGTPIGCFVVSLSFIWSLISSESSAIIKWRGRTYNYSEHTDY